MSGATWISRWNEAASLWGEAMWRACWQGGLFALLIWMLCQRLRSLPAALRYGLWWLVCLKLLFGLCPVFLALPLLPPVPRAAPLVGRPQAVPFRQANVAVFLPAASAPPIASAAVSDAGDAASLSGAAWLMGAWLIGAATLTGCSAISLRRLLRLVRQAEPLSDTTLLAIAQEATAAMGIAALPRILVTPVDVSVLTLGVRRPVILLSRQSLACCSPVELRLVLAHECAHIRRSDAWLGLLPHLAQILFWFHPPAWLACREVGLAREAACDELTLSTLKAHPDLYGRLLLKLGVQRSSWLSLYTPGVSSHFRILQRRLSMLQQITVRTPRRLQGRVIRVVCLIGVALAAPWSIVHAQDPAPATPGRPAAQQSGARDDAPSVHQQAAGDVNPQSVNTKKGDATAAEAAHPAQAQKVAVKKAAVLLKPQVAAPSKTKQTGPDYTRLLMAYLRRLPAPLKVINDGPIKLEATDAADLKLILNKMRAKPVADRRNPVEAAPITQIFQLDNANAETVARTLSTLFVDPARNTVKVVADKRTNVVIVQANEAKLQEIADILHSLDASIDGRYAKAPEPPDTLTWVFPIRYAKAHELADMLTRLFEGKTERSVKAVADERTNSLIVTASDDTAHEIRQLLNKIDVIHPAP